LVSWCRPINRPVYHGERRRDNAGSPQNRTKSKLCHPVNKPYLWRRALLQIVALVAKRLHQGDRAYMIANETILELF
jgi:hypothetical protein